MINITGVVENMTELSPSEVRGGFRPGVRHENREERTDPEAVLRFTATSADYELYGISLSSERFVVRRIARRRSDGAVVRVDAAGLTLAPQPFDIEVNMSGFTFPLSLTAKLATDLGTSENTLTLRITEIGPAARAKLLQLIRAHMTGSEVLPVGEVRVDDTPTPVSAAAAAPAAGRRSVRQRLTLAGALAVLGVVAVASSVSIYERLFTVKSAFAAVTAPRLDILSPLQGQVELSAAKPGGLVARDQMLFSISAPELEAEIAVAEARLAYLGSLAAASPATGATDMSAASGARRIVVPGQPANGTTAAPAAGTITAPAGTPEDLQREMALATSELKALQLRKTGLTAYAPCDCRVTWAQENGAHVQQGDPVLVLVRSAPDDLRIEAMIKLDQAETLHAGQTAWIRQPGSSDATPAVVERVTLDPVQQPRYGFPDWVRHEPTMTSVLLRSEAPIDPDMIGTPVDVELTSQPSLLAWLLGSTPAAAEPLTTAEVR